MSVALVARTLVALAYLSALLWHARAEPMTGVIAAAIVAVWAMPLVRERVTGSGGQRTRS